MQLKQISRFGWIVYVEFWFKSQAAVVTVKCNNHETLNTKFTACKTWSLGVSSIESVPVKFSTYKS